MSGQKEEEAERDEVFALYWTASVQCTETIEGSGFRLVRVSCHEAIFPILRR
jgi:hypothetical protein